LKQPSAFCFIRDYNHTRDLFRRRKKDTEDKTTISPPVNNSKPPYTPLNPVPVK